MKKILALLLAFAMVFSLAACGSEKESAEGGSEGLGVDVIKIGAVAELTGAYATVGDVARICVQWVIDKINAEGGIAGVPVELVMRDCEADPTKALTYTQELVEKEGVNMMVAPNASSCLAAINDYLTENKMIFIAQTSNSNTVVDPAQWPYTFRAYYTNGMAAQGMVNYAIKSSQSKIAIIYDNGNSGQDGLATTYAVMEQMGYNKDNAVAIQYQENDADLGHVAEKIKESGADIGIFWGMGNDCARIVNALDRVDYAEGKFILVANSGVTTTSFLDLAGKNADIVFSMYYEDALATEWNADKSVVTGSVSDGVQKVYDQVYADLGPVGTEKRPIMIQNFLWPYFSLYAYKAAVEATNSLDGDVIKEYFESGRLNTEHPELVIYTNSCPWSATNHELVTYEDLVPACMGADYKVGGEAYIYSEEIINKMK